MKLREYLGQKPVDGRFGIELEVEYDLNKIPAFEKLPEPWKSIEDHSLRNFGVEFVAKKPIYEYDLKGCLEDVCKLINKHNPLDSHRTSVHVHINVQDYNACELWSAITAYWLLENLVTNYCGPDRKGSMYCLALSDAQYVLDVVKDDIEQKIPFRHLDTDRIRYAGLNLTAIPRYGSLEFRNMRGVYDPEIIYTWAFALNHLMEKAAWFKTPTAVFDTYLNVSKEKFVNMLLPEKFAKLITSNKGWEQCIERNEDFAAEMAYLVDDWHEWETKLDHVKKTKGKTAQAIADEMLRQAMVNIIRPNNADMVFLDDDGI